MKQRGSITIFMTLVMSVLLSLFLTVIEGARQNAISMQAQCAFDLAVYSVFAEYNRDLMEQYSLLFVDSSYGERDGSLERVQNHLNAYINENLAQGVTQTMISDVTKAFLENTEIVKCSYATDEQGKVFERQAVAYMEHKYGISYVKELQKELEEANEQDLFSRDVTSERNSNQSIIEQEELAQRDTGEVDENNEPIYEEVTLDNPADRVNGSRSKGILLLVTEKEKVLSEKAISLDTCLSHRTLAHQGDGLASREDLSVAQKLLFDSYMMEKCGNYLKPKEDGALAYQLEFILAGKNNDIDNLKAVVHRLLLIREAANVSYLFADAAKKAEARTLATTAATAAGMPVLIEPITISLLFAWAYAESLYDVNRLLSGKRVMLIKNDKSWHFSLEGMLNYEADMAVSHEETNKETIKDGLSYEEYLRILLAIKPEQQKVSLMMDLVEQDIRVSSHNLNFKLDQCIDYLEIEACVGSKYGYYQEMKRTYYYV